MGLEHYKWYQSQSEYVEVNGHKEKATHRMVVESHHGIQSYFQH